MMTLSNDDIKHITSAASLAAEMGNGLHNDSHSGDWLLSCLDQVDRDKDLRDILSKGTDAKNIYIDLCWKFYRRRGFLDIMALSAFLNIAAILAIAAWIHVFHRVLSWEGRLTVYLAIAGIIPLAFLYAFVAEGFDMRFKGYKSQAFKSIDVIIANHVAAK